MNLELKGLQIGTPAVDLGDLGGFRPTKVVVIGLNGKHSSVEKIAEVADGEVDSIAFLLDCCPASSCITDALRGATNGFKNYCTISLNGFLEENCSDSRD